MNESLEKIGLIPVNDSDSELIEKIYYFTRNDEFAMLGWNEDQLKPFLKMQCDFQNKSYRMHFPDAEFSMILFDDKKVGRMIVDRTENEVRLVDIAILPEFRGNGIGSSLIERLYSESKEKKLPLSLQVEKNNISAYRLYQKLGFENVGESDLYISMEKN
ncbi:MAG TPA: GNAT family N-acetyltransferase [Pyrinomonadaceae bacterium]|nr:GNAT family N-acetyltransferase [Pyrinomonadaceae bacterium]